MDALNVCLVTTIEELPGKQLALISWLAQEGYTVYVYTDDAEAYDQESIVWRPYQAFDSERQYECLYVSPLGKHVLSDQYWRSFKHVPITYARSLFSLVQEAFPVADVRRLADWYDRDTERFDNDPTPWSIDENFRIQWLLIQLQIIRPKSILDVGCGGGNVTWHLIRSYPMPKVIGVDISQKALLRTRDRCRIPVACSLAEKLPFRDKQFDVTTISEVLEHVFDLPAVLSELQRVTKCAVLLTVPVAIDDNIRHVRVFDPTVELAKLPGSINIVEYSDTNGLGKTCCWSMPT